MNKKTASKSNSSKAATASDRTPAKSAPKATSKKPAPSQDEIAVRAYFISEQRQKIGRTGDHLSDWIEAEKQLKAEA